ncbi:MAG TPA: methyltransferase domain-containing protein, partial [Candidatus Bathyarchaeia archaeon]|nr:methyltransferase domain-containing protein [Candidatus Bathyarchaeia archaeon]
SKGPYASWLSELRGRLVRRRLERRVRILNSDGRQLKDVEAESIDGIVSNELICGLPRRSQLGKALSEFYRVLRPGGIMVQGVVFQSNSNAQRTHDQTLALLDPRPTLSPDERRWL